MMDLKIKKHSISSILLWVWLLDIFALTVMRYFLAKLGFYDGLIREFVLTVVASIPLICFFFNMGRLKRRNYTSFFFLYILILITLGVTLIFHPEYKYFFLRSDYGLGRVFRPDCALYAYLFYSLIDSPREILNVLKKFACLDFVYLIIVELLPALLRGYWMDVNYFGQEEQRVYSLSFGYSMLFPTIILLYFFIREKKLVYLLCSMFGCVAIFTQGSRGALLMPVIFMGLMVISNIIENRNIVRRTLKIFGVSFVLFIICLFGAKMLNYFSLYLLSKGVHSRTLESFVMGNFSDDSGRSIIWNAVYDAIRYGGFWGYGFYGDRPFVYPYHYVGYSHNIFLELVCSFGVVGMIISAYIIVGSIYMILSCKDRLWRELFIVFFSISCQLLLSFSFWYIADFWAAMAIGHKYFKLKRCNAV